MLMMQYVHERMLELVRKSYPEDYERYRHFYIRFEFKEKKSTCSKEGQTAKYFFEKRILQITTLSREPADILLSLILELAHHIDIIRRKETHDDRTYLLIVRKLLDTALKRLLFPSSYPFTAPYISYDRCSQARAALILEIVIFCFGRSWIISSSILRSAAQIYLYHFFSVGR